MGRRNAIKGHLGNNKERDHPGLPQQHEEHLVDGESCTIRLHVYVCVCVCMRVHVCTYMVTFKYVVAKTLAVGC